MSVLPLPVLMTEKTVLDNGIRVVTEHLPHMRSVSLGFWVNTGSRDESLDENGIAHFIEHMLFKGTARRTTQQIAKEIDSVGGILNGFTGNEYSSFYVKVLDEHLPLALDLLSDLFINSSFDPQEMEREKNVILQEIKMVEDSPDELIMDLFHRTFWEGFSLGYPIVGLAKTIKKMKRAEIVDFFWNRYLEGGVVITAAGRFDRNLLLETLQGLLGHLPTPKGPSHRVTPKPSSSLLVKNKKLEQVHLCMGTPGPSATDPKRFAYYILNTIFGGGMSSRLFQEIRERQGLAYTVYSFVSVFEGTGMFLTYAGTSRSQLPMVLDIVCKEMKSLKENPLEEKELLAAKDQIKGHLLLSLESTDSIMSRLAKNELYFEHPIPLEEVIAEIERVKTQDVQEVAQETFREDGLSVVALGDVRKRDLPERFHLE